MILPLQGCPNWINSRIGEKTSYFYLVFPIKNFVIVVAVLCISILKVSLAEMPLADFWPFAARCCHRFLLGRGEKCCPTFADKTADGRTEKQTSQMFVRLPIEYPCNFFPILLSLRSSTSQFLKSRSLRCRSLIFAPLLLADVIDSFLEEARSVAPL